MKNNKQLLDLLIFTKICYPKVHEKVMVFMIKGIGKNNAIEVIKAQSYF